MTETLKYILFMIDSKVKQHDGFIFSSYEEAKAYGIDAINDKYCTHFVIGMSVIDLQQKRNMITKVETFGFKGDVKNPLQIELFSPFKNTT